MGTVSAGARQAAPRGGPGSRDRSQHALSHGPARAAQRQLLRTPNHQKGVGHTNSKLYHSGF